MPMCLSLVLGLVALQTQPLVEVKSAEDLKRALTGAKPGAVIVVAAEELQGGIFVSDVHGTEGHPITLRSGSPSGKTTIKGGGSGLQLSKVSHIKIQGFAFRGARDNGLNIDDGGTYDAPSHHITLVDLDISDLPEGNHDGIKLSGIDDFEVRDCTVSRWGGSAIDMVGCHRGKIKSCEFNFGGDSGVQMKGGTSNVTVESCSFVNYGQRGVNMGGSTGFEFFRPPLRAIASGQRFEAKDLTVQGCQFVQGGAPFAFVGVDGAVVHYNTVISPEKWVVRILQETQDPSFVPCRKGVFERNFVIYKSSNWGEGGFNIGPKTDPASFVVKDNYWSFEDRGPQSRPQPPVKEKDGVYGKPITLFKAGPNGFMTPQDPAARSFGAYAFNP